MIDVSKYEKVGEYHNEYMVWFSSKRENIVYLIKFGNEFYVGSSKNIRRRFSQYIATLNKGKYSAVKVQSAFNKNKSFEVFILEHTLKDNLEEREHYYINALCPSLNIQNTKKYDNMNERIKKRIKTCGFTIEQVANKMGITKGGLSKALNGNPTIGTLRKVADVLQVPVTDFFRDEIGDAPASHIEPQQKCPYCGHDLNIKVE